MKKLIWLALLLPTFANAQWVNGVIQRNGSNGSVRYFQGANIDTLAKKSDLIQGLQDSLTKKANRTFDNVASGAIAKSKVDTSATGLQTVSNFFPKGDTRYQRTSERTTVGNSFYTLTNPSAITFPRINANNTVSALSASDFRTAIGAGTSSTTGTVTSVAATVPTGLTVSGSPITTSGTLAFGLQSGYSIPTTAKQTQWDTAYGWGDYRTYGLGTTPPADDWDTVAVNKFVGGNVNTPVSFGQGISVGSSGRFQIVGRNNTFYVRDRAYNAGVWNEIWHSTNFNPSNYIPLTQKASANGVASLDGSGKVPFSQLPTSNPYQGTWNASTNTPTLADGVGTAGDYYRVAVAGTQNLGSGNITFSVGDDVIYSGTIWQRVPGGSVATNLALGTITGTDIEITNSNGTGFTLPEATTTDAGLLSAADKSTIDDLSADYVATTGNQSGLEGNKDWTGNHTFTANYLNITPSGSGGSMVGARKVEFTGNANGSLIRMGNLSGTSSVTLRGYSATYQLTLSDGGIEAAGAANFTGNVTGANLNISNWNTAYSQTRQWDGGSTGLTAATGRTSLGGTTVGQNLFTLTNPSAITFPRINANNTVSALSAADFRTAIGAGTSSTTAPTITNGANVSSASIVTSRHIRTGNVVTGTIVFSVTATAAGSTATTLDFSLPYASNFASAYDATIGTADATNIASDRMTYTYNSFSTSPVTQVINYTYTIIP